jgi:hypothetical protein
MENMRRHKTDIGSVVTRHIIAMDASKAVMSLCLCIASSALLLTTGTAVAQQNERPNFLVIVADDMGYSDLGSYGGEINTPVLDDLAQQGTRYTDFYVAPTCSVTRSMLLSGTDNHIAGLGNMGEMLAPNQVGQPGYEGVLNDRVASVASLLRDSGYHTYMAGKWHLGMKPDEIPHARGFERDFSLLVGAADHFDDGWNIEWQVPKAPYTEDGQPVEKLPKDYYSSKNFTDKTIQFIEEGRGDGKPFLAYMAFTAPHGPLQVPCGATRTSTTKVGMLFDIVVSLACGNWAFWKKASARPIVCGSCRGPLCSPQGLVSRQGGRWRYTRRWLNTWTTRSGAYSTI